LKESESDNEDKSTQTMVLKEERAEASEEDDVNAEGMPHF